MPNRVLADGQYPHFDIEVLWSFILDGLGRPRDQSQDRRDLDHDAWRRRRLARRRGELVLPVLDYEHDGAGATAAPTMRGARPLPKQARRACPSAQSRRAASSGKAGSSRKNSRGLKTILTYPQFWAFAPHRRSRSREVTFLGCHTDLWSPAARDFSSMVDAMGWRKLFPPIRPAADRLGAILPEIAARTGLPADTPVHCGIHDSNASLLPHLMARRGALRGRLDRHLGHRHGGRRRSRCARSGARHSGQRRCLRQPRAVRPLHGWPRVLDAARDRSPAGK